MKYTLLALSAGLLAAQVAFAQGTGEQRPPAPRPYFEYRVEDRAQPGGPGMMASTSATFFARPIPRPAPRPGMMGTTTREDEQGNRVYYNNDERGPGMMGSSTDGRPPMMNGDDNERRPMMGTSTPPRPGVVRALMNHMFQFFGKKGDASSTPPTGSEYSDTNANVDVNAPTTPPLPPRGIQAFFQRFLGLFR